MAKTKKNTFFIVNQRLTYISTQFVLEWAGINPNETMYCSYYDVMRKIDMFLMNNVDFNDTIFLIGFDDDINSKIQDEYKKYNFKILESQPKDFDNIFFKSVALFHKQLKSQNISEKKKYYIQCVKDLINNNLSNKDAYILSLIFYQISPQNFYKDYKDGYNQYRKHNSIVAKHLNEFNKEDKSLYEVYGYYFVLSSIKFMVSYIKMYYNDIDNISIIDINARRVYMKQLKRSKNNINNLCKKYCKNVRGFTDFCSGEITPEFLELTKNMKKIK